ENFGKLINCDAKQTALIPSVSYGLMSAIKNLPLDNGNTALIVSDEFPSDFYSIRSWCNENKKNLKIVTPPDNREKRGEVWNENILNSINEDTAVVVLSSIHWADGTLFKLKEIGEKCKKFNAMYIVDGTQSVGALPIDVNEFKIDALICAAYKWLLGPYSIGMAYYSEFFNNGKPIEQTWINRSNAQDFSSLSNYVDGYTPGAGRYNVGEYGNFILLPMLIRSLGQILEWNPAEIQEYAQKLTKPLIDFLRENGFWIEDDNYRAKHMFGILLPEKINPEEFLLNLRKRKIAVSVRGKSIRISVHLYNNEADINALIGILSELKKVL
ncbi:MAG: aminotransferase class V-fold PLP-dependent enzyme, partial [Ignavibacteriaceae bacterium]